MVATALVATMFAGCVFPVLDEGEPVLGPQPIVKKAVLTIDSNNEDADDIEDFLKVTFEYTHMGPPVPAANLTAEFTTAKGAAVTRSLATFTTKTVLSEGDLVTISGANITSGLVVRQGSAVVAQRGSVTAPWFRVEGVPIPIASTEPGEAAYRLASSAGFTASGSNFDIDTTRVHSMSANLQADVDGDLVFRTSAAPGGGVRLEGRVHAEPTALVDVEASITDDEGTYEAGAKTRDMRGTLDVRGVLEFDVANKLRRAGSGGDFTFDGNVHVWDREHPKSQNYEPEDIEHPMVNEHQAYSEEAVDDGSGDGPPAWVVEFLTKLWSAEVGLGDDYRVHFRMDFGDGGVSYDLIIQVTGDEPRTAGGKIYPSLRVSQVANLIVDPPNKSEATFDLIKTTYWVHKTSHLPVYAQAQYTRNFNREDVQNLIDTLGEEAPFTVPATASLVLRGDQTLELRTYSGDLTVAPIFGLLFANPTNLGGAMPGAAAAFFLVSDIGSQSEPPPTP
ncbi:MAG TPA: hypothetical protein VI818_02450 [Candidatus Thermoplasmatota archaeon]|nr:hypothetical protein [Candidatus Thermoplasmatota archaeon]